MKYRTVLLAATIAATPFASSAEISGGFGLSFGQISAEGSSNTANNTRLDFDLNYSTGNAFGFAVNGSSSQLTDGADDLTVNSLGGEAFYGFGNGYRAGAYFGTLSVSDFVGDNLSSYGLFFGTSGEGHSIDLAFGQLEADGDTANEVSLRGTYDLSQGTSLSGEFSRAWDDGFNVNTFGIGAAHDLSEQASVFGGLNFLSFDDGADQSTTLSLGLAYDLATISSFGATGWIELSRTTFSDSSGVINRVAFGISMPLGDAGAGAPVGSRSGSIGRGNRSGYSSLFSDGVFGAL